MRNSWDQAVAPLDEQHFDSHTVSKKQEVNTSFKPSWTDKIGFTALISIIIISPLFFGSVSETSNLIFSLIIFAGLFVVIAHSLLVKRGSFYKISATVFNSLILLVAFSAIAGAELFFNGFLQVSAHPILNNSNRLIPFNIGYTFLSIFSFTALFLLTSFLISDSRRFTAFLRSTLFVGFSMVIAIAFVHWFYDNGKLFWQFAPTKIIESERARWPFVNSNSLAQFLLLLTFPALVRLEEHARDLISWIRTARVSNSPEIFSSSRGQKAFVRTVLGLVTVFGAFLVLVGTQSRASWMAFTITLFCFILLRSFLLAAEPKSVELRETEHRRKKRRVEGRSKDNWFSKSLALIVNPIKWSKVANLTYVPLLVLGAAFGLILVLNDIGSQILLERLEFGLAHSLEDIRWILYQDTLPILLNNLILGIGLGNWAQVFNEFMSNQIGDLNPVYLHSDPLQLFTEVGILGFLPILLLVAYISKCLWKTLRLETSHNILNFKLRSIGWYCGLLAVILASSFDFPFRIPTISWYFAIVLAKLVRSIDFISSQKDPVIQ